MLKIAEFRNPTPKDVRKKGSKILKLPPVRHCILLSFNVNTGESECVCHIQNAEL